MSAKDNINIDEVRIPLFLLSHSMCVLKAFLELARLGQEKGDEKKVWLAEEEDQR